MVSIQNIQERSEILEYRTSLIEQRMRWWRGLTCGVLALGLANLPFQAEKVGATGDMGIRALTLDQRVTALEQKLVHIKRVNNDLFITGANLHIRNGAGSTQTVNGRGNLVIGYNELRPVDPYLPVTNLRTGSHNLIVGKEHNFSGYGGIVVGLRNSISAMFASVSGGRLNRAAESFASVSGGQANNATGLYAAVSGGESNETEGRSTSVSGGAINEAMGDFASVSGGQSNHAIGGAASVSGGAANDAIQDSSAISGGSNNQTTGYFASVSGGTRNTASGLNSSVSGGFGRTAPAQDDWAAGSLFEDF